MSRGGWIKIYRAFEDWQWWYDEKMVKFFLYLIFKAYSKDCYVGNVFAQRGSFITSYQKMASECGFSVMQIRNMVTKLISTGEITKSSTSKYTMITVQNYEKYQTDNKVDNKQTTSKRTNKQQTNNNIVRNIENREKIEEGASAISPSGDGSDDDEPPAIKPWEYAGFATAEEYDAYLEEKWSK